MKRETSGQILSAVFVDYDNIYLSLRRKNEEAAKRFAKDATGWLAEIDSGRLITPTNKLPTDVQRRIVLNRCYGNPVPRRNQSDNSTDMNSFPFVRHHFLRAGFEIVDCPPLTAQLKNSSDIRMVMDMRDYLHHDTYFDEFIILSGDADFTPVLHRLRAHARRTVVFANDFTAAPYVAIADGEIREADLISAIMMGGKLSADASADEKTLTTRMSTDDPRREIIAEVTSAVRSSVTPVPLEALAERATRALGHERTVGSNWAGVGSFRELLQQSLPEGIRLSDTAPYVVYDVKRQLANEASRAPSRSEPIERPMPTLDKPVAAPRTAAPDLPPARPVSQHTQAIEPAPVTIKRGVPPQRTTQPLTPTAPPAATSQHRDTSIDLPLPPQRAPVPRQAIAAPAKTADSATALQQSIARIHDACQAPPLSPPEYRALFDVMATEINEVGLQGAQSLTNIINRGRELGLDFRRDDIRFVLDVVSEADPWFEQGASANLFAGRFRNFVVARCRSHGLNLTADEIDLIDAWFTGGPSPAASAPAQRTTQTPATVPARTAPPANPAPAQQEDRNDRWWATDERAPSADLRAPAGRAQTGQAFEMPPLGPTAYAPAGSDDLGGGDEFPRIVRTRLRG